MFDLDHEILEWRQKLAAAGLRRHEQIDELEDHLRNDIEDQLRSGVGVREAFETAVKRVGEVSALRVEFEKAMTAKPKRMLWWGVTAKTAGCLITVWVVVLAASYFASGLGPAIKIGTALFLVPASLALAWTIWWYCRSRLHATPPMLGFTLSPRAQQSLENAKLEAIRLGHDYVGTEHLLLALLRLDGGVIGTTLAKAGVGRETLRAAIEERIIANTAQGFGPSLPFTPRVNKALRLAISEAGCNQKALDAGHILLGLLRERSGIGGRVLRRLGFKVGQVRSCLTGL
jgi:hypothetical protein